MIMTMILLMVMKTMLILFCIPKNCQCFENIFSLEEKMNRVKEGQYLKRKSN